MYTGLYRLRLSGDLKDVVDVEYWGGSDRHICKVEGRVLFHDADGFSYYDDMTRRMMPLASDTIMSSASTRLFSGLRISRSPSRLMPSSWRESRVGIAIVDLLFSRAVPAASIQK